MANLHYVLAPAGLLKKADLPARWGLLTLGDAGVSVTARADWIECACTEQVEAQIARTLTADIFRAEDRALGSINRELFTQQQELAQRIRAIKPALLEQQRAALIADRPAKTAGDAIRPSPRRAVPL